MKSDTLINYFKNLKENDKITQSFLIGNVSFDDVKEELQYIFSKYIINDDISIDNNPNIIILRANEKSISREDIRSLLANLKSTSQFINKKIYIIEDSELLNVQSNNALLKTLEEPSEGIYAFLLTKNIDSILPTISSRCQKIFISSAADDNLNNDEIDIANKIIDSIENNNVKTIYKFNEIYSIINDRNSLLNILKLILNIYEESLMAVVNNIDKKNIIIEKNDLDKISRKMIVINNNINRLNNNMNKNISIDRFIIEMGKVK